MKNDSINEIIEYLIQSQSQLREYTILVPHSLKVSFKFFDKYKDTKLIYYSSESELKKQMNFLVDDTNDIILVTLSRFKDNMLQKGFEKIERKILESKSQKIYYLNLINYYMLPDIFFNYMTECIIVDYLKMSEISKKFEINFKKEKEYHITCKNGTNIIFEIDNNNINKEYLGDLETKIFQLPCGEVFAPIKEGTANGTICYQNKKKIEKIEIENGRSINATNPEDLDRVICEFGIGTNEKVKFIPGIDFSEKSLGTCHFGFGDNLMFGGTVEANYHYDIVISDYKIKGK